MKTLSHQNLIKHWLLNTAIDFPRPLLHVLPKVRGMVLNAKEIPGCAPAEYAQGLRSLYLSGQISFSSEDPLDELQSESGVNSILNRYLSLLHEPPEERRARCERHVHPRDPNFPSVEFALTESGGALWETIARPEWDRFFDCGVNYGDSDEETGDAVSPDLNLLMARLGWFPELSSEAIDIQSIELKEHSDYPVLYWKKLPHVYRATFKCKQAEARWKQPDFADHPMEPKWFREWWSTTVTFYTKPWKLRDWPRSS